MRGSIRSPNDSYGPTTTPKARRLYDSFDDAALDVRRNYQPLYATAAGSARSLGSATSASSTVIRGFQAQTAAAEAQMEQERLRAESIAAAAFKAEERAKLAEREKMTSRIRSGRCKQGWRLIGLTAGIRWRVRRTAANPPWRVRPAGQQPIGRLTTTCAVKKERRGRLPIRLSRRRPRHSRRVLLRCQNASQ